MLARIFYKDSHGEQTIEGVTPLFFPIIIERLICDGTETSFKFYDKDHLSTEDLSNQELSDIAQCFFTELLAYGFTYLLVSDPSMKDGYDPDTTYFLTMNSDIVFCINQITDYLGKVEFSIEVVDQNKLVDRMQPHDCFINRIIAQSFYSILNDTTLFDKKVEETKKQLNLKLFGNFTTDHVAELIDSSLSDILVEHPYFCDDTYIYDDDYEYPYVPNSYNEEDLLCHEDIKSVLNELIDDSFNINSAIYVCFTDFSTGEIMKSTKYIPHIRLASLDSFCNGYIDYHELRNHPEHILKYTKITKDGQKIVGYTDVNEACTNYSMLLKAMLNNDLSDFDMQPHPERHASIHIIDDENNLLDDSVFKQNGFIYKPNTLMIELFNPEESSRFDDYMQEHPELHMYY